MLFALLPVRTRPLALLLALAAPAIAQVPAGRLVVASFAWAPANFPGLGGLFVVDPANPAVPTPITGLPCEVTGACPTPGTPWCGTDFVVRLPATEQLLVSGPNTVGQMVNAYLLTLQGSAVTAVLTYPLATFLSANGLDVPAAALLADGRVLLAVDVLSMGAPGPLAGSLLGILDPRRPPADPLAVTPLPLAGIPAGFINALAVDDAAGVVYFAMLGTTTTSIYVVPLAGGTPTTIASVPGGITCMAVLPDGTLLAAGYAGAQQRLYSIQPVTWLGSVFPNVAANGAINAMRLDPVSGDLFFVANVAAAGTTDLMRLSPCSPQAPPPLLVTHGPAGGWGCPAGIDLPARLEPFGLPSGASPLPIWALAPNPGGAPALGNAAFSLTNTHTPPAALRLWVLGFARGDVLLPTTAVHLLLAPPQLLLTGGETLALPIPNAPGLAGLRLLVQCAHLTAAEVSASSGLQVRL